MFIILSTSFPSLRKVKQIDEKSSLRPSRLDLIETLVEKLQYEES